MGNNYALEQLPDYNNESFNFDDLQSTLELELEDHFSDLSDLNLDLENIGNPASLEETISSVVWEQVINQIGTVAGDEFIKENKGLNLDLRKSAHIQTAENFEKGKIAIHNNEIKYQERYNKSRKNFYTDPNNEYFIEANESLKNENKGEKYRYNLNAKAWEQDIKGKWKSKLVDEKNKYSYRGEFDYGRPSGSAANNTAIDHTVPVAEFVRDPRMNAFVDKEQQLKLASSENNLNEIDKSVNSSKSDYSVEEFLNSKRDGKTPDERFAFDKELMIKKDKKQRMDNEKAIAEGEKIAFETGKKSQKQEAFRIGGKALQAVLMGLLADLVKKIIQKLIVWLTTAKKNFTSFLDSLKDAISNFLKDLKKHLVNATDTLLTTIATAIFGSIVNMVKKAWIFIKQGYKSVKEALNHLKDPNNKGKSLSVLMLEVGKIITAGLTVGGAIVLGEVIEKSMSAIPFLAFPIPVIGSLASILGIFFGAIGSGILGALALNLIDRMIANKKRSLLTEAKISKSNEILALQDQLIHVVSENLQITKGQLFVNADERHTNLSKNLNLLPAGDAAPDNSRTQNDDDIDELFNLLNA